MRKILIFLAITAALNAEESAFAQAGYDDTPIKVVEKYVEDTRNCDAKSMLDALYLGDNSFDLRTVLLERGKKKCADPKYREKMKKGKLVKTEMKSQNETTSVVKVITKNPDGGTEIYDEMELLKIDGKWLIKMPQM